jgi:hypothetical protein
MVTDNAGWYGVGCAMCDVRFEEWEIRGEGRFKI